MAMIFIDNILSKAAGRPLFCYHTTDLAVVAIFPQKNTIILKNRLTACQNSDRIGSTCDWVLFFLRTFRFGGRRKTAEQGGKRLTPSCRAAQSNKEVPLDAREDYFEMQRVQAEKLQHDEEQEEQS